MTLLTPEEGKYVLGLYEKSGNRPSKAVELFKERFGHIILPARIRYKWRAEGYERNSHGGHRHGLSEGEIKGLHSKYGGDLRRMMEDVGRNYSSGLVKRCRELNLDLHNIPSREKRIESTDDPFPNHIL